MAGGNSCTAYATATSTVTVCAVVWTALDTMPARRVT
jgi:hypothetical protein